MLKALFGTAAEDLRLTVSEALASQRKVIADQQARIEALIGEKNDALAALRERESDLLALKALIDNVRDHGAFPTASVSVGKTEPVPPRKPSFAQSSIASGHMRRTDRKEAF